MRVGALGLDPMSRDAWVDGEAVRPLNKEFALALRLAAEPTRVFTRAELLSRGGWGFQSVEATRTAGLARPPACMQAPAARPPAVRGQTCGGSATACWMGEVGVVSRAVAIAGWVAAGLVGALAVERRAAAPRRPDGGRRARVSRAARALGDRRGAGLAAPAEETTALTGTPAGDQTPNWAGRRSRSTICRAR